MSKLGISIYARLAGMLLLYEGCNSHKRPIWYQKAVCYWFYVSISAHEKPFREGYVAFHAIPNPLIWTVSIQDDCNCPEVQDYSRTLAILFFGIRYV